MVLFGNYRWSISLNDLHIDPILLLTVPDFHYIDLTNGLTEGSTHLHSVTMEIPDPFDDKFISDMFLQVLGPMCLLAKNGGVLLTLRGQNLAQVLAKRTSARVIRHVHRWG